MWICTACGADVQDDWEVCWNCTRPRDDTQTIPLPPPPSSAPHQPGIKGGQCPQCSAQTIIPNILVSDFVSGSTRELCLIVAEYPEALIFKNLVHSAVYAWVCGTCGYTEFYAAEPALLWETYQRSLLSEDDTAEHEDDE